MEIIKSVDELSDLLKLDKKLINWLIYGEKSKQYSQFEIKKSNGNIRTIFNPVFSLKVIQRWILEKILYDHPISRYSYGFKRDSGSPILHCLEKHRNNTYFLKIDIKDFFPSIDFKRVLYIFATIGFDKTISYALTRLCTYNDMLPTGAVTSPYISNLVCRKLDSRISTYCNKRDIVYSRYADDLIFSNNNRNDLKRIFNFVKSIIEDEGFAINETKTRFITPKSRKKILGLNIDNNCVYAPRELKRKVRAMTFYSIKNNDLKTRKELEGYVAFIESIEPNYRDRFDKYYEKVKNKFGINN